MMYKYFGIAMEDCDIRSVLLENKVILMNSNYVVFSWSEKIVCKFIYGSFTTIVSIMKRPLVISFACNTFSEGVCRGIFLAFALSDVTIGAYSSQISDKKKIPCSVLILPLRNCLVFLPSSIKAQK